MTEHSERAHRARMVSELWGMPIRIDNRVPRDRIVAWGPRGMQGVIVNVDTFWHLRGPESWARFAVALRRRTMARLRPA